jgi:Cu+-exporting ATPase
MVGMGVGARLGILLRGGRALELTPRLTAIIFDKTGTLTTGAPMVTRYTSVRPDMAADRVLWFAACAETCSEHILGRSIVRHARALMLEPLQQPLAFQAVTGRGIRCTVATTRVCVGSRDFLTCEGIDTRNAMLVEVAEEAEEAGKMCTYVALDGTMAGKCSLDAVFLQSLRDTNVPRRADRG